MLIKQYLPPKSDNCKKRSSKMALNKKKEIVNLILTKNLLVRYLTLDTNTIITQAKLGQKIQVKILTECE